MQNWGAGLREPCIGRLDRAGRPLRRRRPHLAAGQRQATPGKAAPDLLLAGTARSLPYPTLPYPTLPACLPACRLYCDDTLPAPLPFLRHVRSLSFFQPACWARPEGHFDILI
jgi:hypothetical protein